MSSTAPPDHGAQPPVFVMLPAGKEAYRPGGSIPAMGTAVKVLGVTQFLTSLPCIALGVGAFMFECQYGYILTGIWMGIFVFVSGILGISAGSSRDQCPLSCYHMLSIINILSGTALIAIHTLSVLQELTTCTVATQTCPALCLTFDTLLVSLGVVHFFLALTSSVVSASLNTKITQSKQQIFPLIPYPLQGHRPAMSPQDLAEASGTASGNKPTDVRLQELDFNDEGFKFI